MPRLSSAQKQVQSDFLQQVHDGRLDKSVAEGSGLPNLAYTCPDFYELEQQTVFRDNWVFAGFLHQLAQVGDMLPVEVAGQPVVLVMTEDAGILAFHNVCRHRGAKLVTEARNSKKFICPNHSWSYSLCGKLIARPHFLGGEQHDVNQSECHRADLVEIRCVTWHDWIFVNLSGEADDFANCIEPITRKLDGYDLNAMVFSESLEFEINANWKLPIENFIEPYHVFSCHPWLNDFVGMDEREAPTFDEKVLLCGYQFQKTDPARGGELPWFPNLPAVATGSCCSRTLRLKYSRTRLTCLLPGHRQLKNAVKRSRYILLAKLRRPKNTMQPGRMLSITGMISTTKTLALSSACKKAAAPTDLTAAYYLLTGIRCSSTTRNWLPNLLAAHPKNSGSRTWPLYKSLRIPY
jgi:phenylpropionate dioxygenase-like ring-hydroxylating dioxygenase large terminal subunit